MDDKELPISPALLLKAYAAGIFPMAESADDPDLHWVEPKMRGILPLDRFHVSDRLARLVRAERFDIRADQDFAAVIEACAAPRAASRETWINGPIRQLYQRLFDMGYCHSIEVREGDALVGGLYGIALGSAFFGESMFHRVRDCSKLALVHLVARLKAGGFTLLDTQFVTEHLQQFGAVAISRAEYRKRLAEAVNRPADFGIWPLDRSPSAKGVFAALAL